MSRKTAALLVVLILLPLVRVSSTYHVFSRTIDEPAHVEAGTEWLTKNTYDRDTEHPPLARAAEALAAMVWRGGDEVIHARAGNLPFLLIALIVVGVWTRRLFGTTTALLAMAIFGALPPVLGHAGLATTDCAAMAMTLLALYRFALWFETPSWRNALILGVVIALGLLSKFSFLVYFPIGALSLMAMRLKVPRVRQLPAMALIAALLVWAGYKFDVGNLNDARLKVLTPDAVQFVAASYAKAPGYEWVRPDLILKCRRDCTEAAKVGVTGIDFVDWAKAAGYPSPLALRSGRDTMKGAPPVRRRFLGTVLEPFRVVAHDIARRGTIPAPLFFAGIDVVRHHTEVGHPAFLLGRSGDHGWWYYFPVVFFFKTPVAFVLLCIAGIVMIVRRGSSVARGVAIAPIVMLIPAMTSGINIGLRHILPLYPFFAIAAAYAVTMEDRRPRLSGQARAPVLHLLAILLLAWYFIAGAVAHPDYLAYFNECAAHPENIATDSKLDWGQDLKRLGEVVASEHLAPLHVAAFGDSGRYVNAPPLHPNERVTGWIALSETKLHYPGGEGYRWLESYKPVRRVGKSIRLYYLK
jgi:4-amino-4-deoxy-L-arabinose transferase-like glycosyltransferase